MNPKKELSIILPVLNEELNLKYLIPEISKIANEVVLNNYEIIVVDDNSTDNTKTLINNFLTKNFHIVYKVRGDVKSLPLSIYEGIEVAKYQNVMWLDADGSMDAEAIKLLIENYFYEECDVLIGSRFVDGGGFKGIDNSSKNSILKIIDNLYKSEDSILAVFLSKVFNNILQLILSINISDLTSGFIIGKKSLFKKNMFDNFIYGEYFIFMAVSLINQNINVKEIGYICKTRNFGDSKTSGSILRLLRLSIPYLKIAYKSRKVLHGN